MGRYKTGSIIILRDGSIYARVRFKNASGQRCERRKRAINTEHAEALRRELVESVESEPKPVYSTVQKVWASVFIYCVQLMDGGIQPIKIGMARDVSERLKALATGAPYDLELLASWRTTVPEEGRIHRQFKHLRMNGEWFRPEPELLAFIEAKSVVESVGETENDMLPNGFQPLTFRLGVNSASYHPAADNSSCLQNGLVSCLSPIIESHPLSRDTSDLQSYPLVESVGGDSMPRSRTGSIFQLKDGTWWARVSFTDETGKRRERWRRALNKTDAKDKRDDLLAEIKKHGILAFANDRITFEELAAYYEKSYLIPAEYTDGRKIAGVRDPQKRKATLKHLKDYFGRKRLRSIVYADLRNYKLARLRSKSQRDGKSPLTIATVNRELSLLRRMLHVARQQRWITESPFQFGEALITPADEKHRERVLSREEETRLLAQCTGPREHLKGIVICGLDTGMRRAEVLRLRWCDVDLKNMLLTVAAMHTKTLRHRQLAVSERLKAEMEVLYALARPEPTDRVFGLSNNFKRSFGTACTNAGIKDLRFHDLRHTFATRLAEAGLGDALIARLLGHSQVKTTYRYLQVTEETARRAVELLK